MAEQMLKEKEKPEEIKKGLVAAFEIISDISLPDGKYAGNEKIGDGALLYIPHDSLEVKPHNPNNAEERETAIESCMKGDWAASWQRSITGPDVPEETAERTRRTLCEGLYD